MYRYGVLLKNKILLSLNDNVVYLAFYKLLLKHNKKKI